MLCDERVPWDCSRFCREPIDNELVMKNFIEKPFAATSNRFRGRARHVVVLGKTDSGKSCFFRHLAQQDINAGRGFLDLHGDTTPYLLGVIDARERGRARASASTMNS